ncbi:MAG TPA: chalcone isomerase family protein [Thiobacillus sp.]
MLTRLILVWALLACGTAWATDIAGVKIDDTIQLEERNLPLNGAGIRTRFFFKIYVAALYLPARTSRAADALAMKGPKQIRLTLLRGVDADSFTAAFSKGFDSNTPTAERDALNPRVNAFNQLILNVGQAREGDTFTLTLSGTDTVLALNGQALGKPIAGEDFYRAMLRIWLGDQPVQADLKSALLGGR